MSNSALNTTKKRARSEPCLDAADERPAKRRTQSVPPSSRGYIIGRRFFSKKRERPDPDSDEDERPAKRRPPKRLAPPESRVLNTRPLPPIRRLPNEILQTIFEIDQPPGNLFQLKPSEASTELSDVWRISVAHRKTIVSVCKLWRQIGVGSLYRNIAITNPRMLSTLTGTLERKKALGELVRAVFLMANIECCGPLYTEKPHKDFVRLLQLCPKLTRLAYIPPIRRAGFPQTFPALPRHVTLLNIGPQKSGPFRPLDQQRLIPPVLQQCCSQLEELWVPAAHSPELDVLSLSFPRLRTLYLTCEGVSKTFADNWDMPQLTHLTFLPIDPRLETLAESLEPLFAEYKRILQKHGATLTSLVFPPTYPDPAEGSQDQDVSHDALVALCPALTHLVLPGIPPISQMVTAPLPNVRALDIWCSDDWYEALRTEHELARLLARCFPNLERRTRLIDPLLVNLFVDPPRALCVLDNNSRSRELPSPAAVAALADKNADWDDEEEAGWSRLPGRAVAPAGLRYEGIALRERVFGSGLAMHYTTNLRFDYDSTTEDEEDEEDEDGSSDGQQGGDEEESNGESEEASRSVSVPAAEGSGSLQIGPTLRHLLQAALPAAVFEILERAGFDLLFGS